MSLAVVVPTIGRPTLVNTLESVASQVVAGDQVIVMDDGPHAGAAALVARLYARSPATWTYQVVDQLGSWGHASRNLALDREVDATHVCTIDDDDVYLPGALATIRAVGCRDVPVVFKARWGAGHPAAGVELWHRPEVRLGNVATPMVVWPAGARARFGLSYTGDFDFFRALEAEYGALEWLDYRICEVRPVAVEEVTA